MAFLCDSNDRGSECECHLQGYRITGAAQGCLAYSGMNSLSKEGLVQARDRSDRPGERPRIGRSAKYLEIFKSS